MRLLMIEDDARHSAVVRHHLSCRWPQAQLTISSPVTQGPLAPEFLAQGYDAVLLAREWPGGGRGIEWARELLARRGFAPLIYLSERGDDAEAKEALALGAHATLSRAKIEHDKLLEAIGSAAAKQEALRAIWRTSSEGLAAQKFNGVYI